jgi:hypothetical protein
MMMAMVNTVTSAKKILGRRLRTTLGETAWSARVGVGVPGRGAVSAPTIGRAMLMLRP